MNAPLLRSRCGRAAGQARSVCSVSRSLFGAEGAERTALVETGVGLARASDLEPVPGGFRACTLSSACRTLQVIVARTGPQR
jgi:hypothetical protein